MRASACHFFAWGFALGLQGFAHLASNRAMRQDDDLRIRPGRIRKARSQRAKPFMAQVLAAAERAGGMRRLRRNCRTWPILSRYWSTKLMMNPSGRACSGSGCGPSRGRRRSTPAMVSGSA